ncbi:SprT family protein [Salibacterium halotolerans]|uniref:Protein SprT-like n=1 Tax=Salibacterium halotolerans TaxID=1884432 RepID=A0A1I5XFT9_9BACI|nr:SprT family protein [Salibacterium halotolerans]SFQ30842.1 SprT-like protein [Salibacterium halotolerans]
MNPSRLQRLTEDISMTFFQRPFKHRVVFNNRLRTTGGRYMLGTHHIELNPKHYERFGEEELKAIIKHELCHYHLHIEGKGYRHKDKDFKQLLEKVGGARYCTAMPDQKNQTRTRHYYECSSCGAAFERKRRVNTEKFVCGRCGGTLKKIEESLDRV